MEIYLPKTLHLFMDTHFQMLTSASSSVLSVIIGGKLHMYLAVIHYCLLLKFSGTVATV